MQAKAEELLNHWILVLPTILLVAFFAIPQTDTFPPRTDEFTTMFTIGWTANEPYSPFDVVQSLAAVAPNHPPLYFVILNIWGSLVGEDIALGRVLSTFAGLISVAIIYRIARERLAPIAGLLIVIILLSNAFYNFYLVYLRMYTLLVMTSALLYWVYMRILLHEGTVTRRSYAALFAACFALANTHVLSIPLIFALSLYHLLHVKRNRRWRNITITAGAALMLCLPWTYILVSRGVDLTNSHLPLEPSDGWQLLLEWVSVMFAENALLLLITAIAIVIELRPSCGFCFRNCLILLYFLIPLVLIAHFTGFIPPGRMRLTLSGLVPLLLVITCGYYRLYQYRSYLGALVLLWVVAGLSYHQAGHWTQFLSATSSYPELIPWHAVSRIVTSPEAEAPVIGYQFDEFHLFFPSNTEFAQYEHFFSPYGIDVDAAADLSEFEDIIRRDAVMQPSKWVMYRKANVSSVQAPELQSIMNANNYEACEVRELGTDTVLILYSWTVLNCQDERAKASHSTDLIDYAFYGVVVDVAKDSALLAESWTSKQAFTPERYSLSYQLISADWAVVAQLDLTLVHEGSLRQFAIDISDAPAGAYRLVAILYDNQTNERFDWVGNPSEPPYLLKLADVEIPKEKPEARE
ncbi:MAG: glycosyltransferase family 39 protein [Chloroflexi bacterium]|nr:glycosyltransferase family 39 protein [Chloroflexota bacterium]